MRGTYEASGLPYHQSEFLARQGFEYEAFVYHPPACFRKVAVLVRRDLVAGIAAVLTLTSRLLVRARFSGSMLFDGSFHLPHSQRHDCEDVWQLTVQEVQDSMLRIRHQDHVLLGIDANLELCMPCDGFVPSACLRSLLQTFALDFTVPASRTWWNHAQSRKIDYILFNGPRASAATQGVDEDVAHLVGVDHALGSATITTTKIFKRHRRKRPNKCGKWSLRLGDTLQSCSRLAASQSPICMNTIELLASKVSLRPQSFRYRDPPEIKELVKQRKECSDPHVAKELAIQVVGMRRAHKQAWLVNVLERARSGDFQAISYMKRRQSMGHTHCSYLTRAGSEVQALRDLRHFCAAKYTASRPLDSELAFRMVWCHAKDCVPQPFTLDEVRGVLSGFKHGKSCGTDGVSYELLDVIAHSDAPLQSSLNS